MFWAASGYYFSFILKILAFLEGPTLRIPPCFRSGTNKGDSYEGGILNIIYPDFKLISMFLKKKEGNVQKS